MSAPYLSSSAAIENTYRMACALDAKREESEALSRFNLVCDSLERLVLRNIGAAVDVRYAILSLGNISEIYERRGDTKKALAFRECQLAFLEHMKKEQEQPNDDDDDTPEVIEVVSTATAYSRLFKRIQAARDLPDRSEESAEEIMRKYKEAVAKEEEQRVERFVQLLEQKNAARQAEIENSFWRRNLHRMVDHPFVFLFVVLGIGVFVLLAFKSKPKKKKMVIPEGMDERLDFLEKMLKQAPEKEQKPRATVRKRTPQPQRSKEPAPMVDNRLFEI
jgi:hypothetical protein